jgi:putative FmdB family regulatory protein
MPMFEYACRGCRHEFELLVRAQTVIECPQCHSADLEKQLSVFAVSTGGSKSMARAMPSGPCGSCGHPDGPGSCSVN